MKEQSENNIKLGGLSIFMLFAATLIIIFAFIAPAIFVQPTKVGLDFSKTGEIGDTISGIMNPFIAIAGVLLTFLAFFIQFKANQLQRNLFREELIEQQNQFKKTQFENQFYEMLRLHKENVNEIEITLIKYSSSNRSNDWTEEKINGRGAFNYLIHEFELCYQISKKGFPGEPVNVLINEAYGLFFHGLNNELVEKHDCYKLAFKLAEQHKIYKYRELSHLVTSMLSINGWEYELPYPILEGFSHQLAHYYRHLFQFVKFVVSQENEMLSYEDKRKYLRILRAQLSNQEQAMLFYNWFSNFGKQWENEQNKFFTDYRMIHNIYQELLLKEISLEELFNIEGDYLKEKERENDSLFEYQDW